MNIDTLLYIARTTRKRILTMHYKAHAGHLGSGLSVLEALVTLFHAVMGTDDRFILSKGHAAGALYATLWSKGLLSDTDLDTFCQDGTRLAAHPHGNCPSLLFPTGSLGHGPSLACGLALAARQRGSARHIWCLCGDGEWQEGACWEALAFAVHHQLANLTLLIDQNRLQGFGTTMETVSVSDLSVRLGAFGARVLSVDGHNPAAILQAATCMRERERERKNAPRIILLNTLKGKGLRNAGEISCHYLPLSTEEYTLLMRADDGDAHA